jgi:glycosyltransferase A (GT-A) superfamily protein (DUF2064 family)
MRVLVMAKAPVAGRVKTRLGAVIGPDAAAELAAAALLDTIDAASAAVGAGCCRLSLDGSLSGAVRGLEITERVRGWTVTPQRGDGFAARLATAHLDAGSGPVAQIGMDTPQVTPAQLCQVFSDLVDLDAVLGPAEDGGWWVLGRRDPRAAQALSDVAMSEPTTYDDTWAALEARQQRVGSTESLRDVDTVEDAEVVASRAPHTRFARAWKELGAIAS